jgi:hypothetical protein
MSSERTPEPIPAEEAFLARLADVSPVSGSVEQVHLAAAVSAARDATAAPSRRPATRPAISWRNPRMALSKIAAIVAGLSLPAKAFAATAVTAAAIGGAAVTGNLPTTPEAADDGLGTATEQTGFEVPAHGQPENLPGGNGGDVTTNEVEGAENNGVDGQATAEEAKEDGRAFGEATSTEAKAKSDDKRAAAEAKAAEARARAEAEARREAAQQRAAEAEARRAEAQSNAGSADDIDTSDTDDDEDTSETGSERSAEGRAKAGGASGR